MALWRLANIVLRSGALACGLTSLWLLTQSPFAEPFVERGTAEARLALEQAMAAQVTPDWLHPRVDLALAEPDMIALESYLALADRYGIELGPERTAAIAALRQKQNGWAGQATACATCAWDIHSCDSLKRLAACSLPVEMTPLGDLNALRRAGTAWATGAEVDRIEVGLAALGLGASTAVLASGGASTAAKAGATALRLGRRMGTLTPGLVHSLRASVPPLRQLRRGEGLTPLARLTADLGAVRQNTSLPETLMLMRHVETADDAARLARLSAVAGTDTRPALMALGKARAFRLLVRLGALAHATLTMLGAFAVQLAALALSLVLRALRRQIAVAGRRRAAHTQERRSCASSLSSSTTAASA